MSGLEYYLEGVFVGVIVGLIFGYLWGEKEAGARIVLGEAEKIIEKNLSALKKMAAEKEAKKK